MKYKIPCTNDLYIDDNYFIYNLSGELIFNTAEVLIDIQNTSKTLVSEWLYLYARHQFPESINIDHIQFYRLPDFRDNFPWRAKFTKPYYYDREHRIVPMCPNLAISKNGHIINTWTSKECKPWKEEYLMFGAYRPTHNKYCHMRVHILVANSWINKNQDDIHPICNHKDGNKYNPYYLNLEWVSYKENAEHALSSGLINNSRKCRLRHKDTGEILIFESIQQVASFLNIGAAHLYKETSSLNHLFNGYELRLDNDHRPWLYTPDVIVMNDLIARYIIRVEELDCIRIFNGAQAFGSYYNLLNTENPLSLKIYLNRFKEKYPDYNVTVIDQVIELPIQVLDILTNQVTEYDSMQEVADKLHLNKASVRYSVKSNGSIIHKHYRIRYKSNKPWPKENTKYVPIAISVTDKSNNIKKEYPSLLAASLEYGLSLRKLQRMLDHSLPNDQYIIQQIEESSTTSRET